MVKCLVMALMALLVFVLVSVRRTPLSNIDHAMQRNLWINNGEGCLLMMKSCRDENLALGLNERFSGIN